MNKTDLRTFNRYKKAVQRERQRQYIQTITGGELTTAEAIITRLMGMDAEKQEQIKKLLAS